MAEIQKQSHHDTNYVFHRLLLDGGFVFCAMTNEVSEQAGVLLGLMIDEPQSLFHSFQVGAANFFIYSSFVSSILF